MHIIYCIIVRIGCSALLNTKITSVEKNLPGRLSDRLLAMIAVAKNAFKKEDALIITDGVCIEAGTSRWQILCCTIYIFLIHLNGLEI